MVALVAAAVAFWITKSFQLAGKILSAFGAAGTTNAVAIAAANAAAGAIAGAAGSVAGQGVGVLTGIQDRIDWRGVGLSAISGAVSGYMGPSQSGGFIAGLERGVASNVVTQTIGVAVGLQKKFDWAGVAAAGLQGGVSTLVANSSWVPQATANPLSPSSLLNAAIPGVAGAVASAAAQSALTRTDFGDNLRALLPEVIGSTIGNALAARAVMNAAEAQSTSGPADRGPQAATAFTADNVFFGQTDMLGIDGLAPPRFVVVDGLSDRAGRPVNGSYQPGETPDDPGTAAISGEVYRNAFRSSAGAAQFYAALQEEIGHSISIRTGIALPDFPNARWENGGVLGGLAVRSALSQGSGDIAFSIGTTSGSATLSASRSDLSRIFYDTFTPERLLSGSPDGGAYQQKTQARFARDLNYRKAQLEAGLKETGQWIEIQRKMLTSPDLRDRILSGLVGSAAYTMEQGDAANLVQIYPKAATDSTLSSAIAGDRGTGRYRLTDALFAVAQMGVGVKVATLGTQRSEVATAKGIGTAKDLRIPNFLSPRQELHSPPVMDGRSVLTANPSNLLQSLHNGDFTILRQPKPGQVVVDFGKPIGEYWSNGVKVGVTHYGSVSYGKNGAHIIPANPTQR